jgi:hypothetical protein
MTDIDNTLRIRDIFPEIPEQMLIEAISFINPDVAQTYTEIRHLNETMSNEQRCILATADGGSEDGFVTAYNKYNPTSVYVIDPNWQDLCQITALKKVIELGFTRTPKLTKSNWESFEAKHRLEILCNGVYLNDSRYGLFKTLPDEFESCTRYITRTNTVISFILAGFEFEWRPPSYSKIGVAIPYFFYILAKSKSDSSLKRIVEYQYKHGIITDMKKPSVIGDSLCSKILRSRITPDL